jgi:hypothetical protein
MMTGVGTQTPSSDSSSKKEESGKRRNFAVQGIYTDIPWISRDLKLLSEIEEEMAFSSQGSPRRVSG